jgi:hypothetical protein
MLSRGLYYLRYITQIFKLNNNCEAHQNEQ